MAMAATNDDFASLMQGLAMCISVYGATPEDEPTVSKRLKIPMVNLHNLDPNGTFKVYLSNDRQELVMELCKSRQALAHEKREAMVDEDSVVAIMEGVESDL